IAIFAFDTPFPLIVLMAAAIGYLGSRWAPGVFAIAIHTRAKDAPHAPALIDDDTPTPAHARWSRTFLIKVLGIGASLWLIAM
ncbi:chromate transporter, partial [Klebsiella pneumoniae]|nr:chromate transporter [Klebsiella pneumoniae]